MSYTNRRVAEIADVLKERMESLENKADILKAPELKALYTEIPTLKPEERGEFGKETNALRQELQAAVNSQQSTVIELPPIDVTAPFDINVPTDKRPSLLSSEFGSRHPIMVEIEQIQDIFRRMGFAIESSRLIDDEYHMFDSLNFPPGIRPVTITIRLLLQKA